MSVDRARQVAARVHDLPPLPESALIGRYAREGTMRGGGGWLLALLCVPWSPGVRAEVRDASAQGFTLENARVVSVDPETAWKALVDDVDRWWPKDHTWWGEASRLSIEPRAGGCFCELEGGRQARHMAVVFVDPGKLLRMTGGLGPLQGMGLHGAMEWRFAPLDGGTLVALWYRAGGYTPDDLSGFAPVVDKVQALQLGALADFLEAQRPSGDREPGEAAP